MIECIGMNEHTIKMFHFRQKFIQYQKKQTNIKDIDR